MMCSKGDQIKICPKKGRRGTRYDSALLLVFERILSISVPNPQEMTASALVLWPSARSLLMLDLNGPHQHAVVFLVRFGNKIKPDLL